MSEFAYIIYIYIYIYLWELNQTVLELDFKAVKFLFLWTQYWERVNSLISKFPKSHGTVKYILKEHVSLHLSWLGDSYLFVLTPCSLFILQKIELIFKRQHVHQLTKFLKLLFRVCIFHVLSVLLRSTSLVSSNSFYMYFNTSSKRVLI
jgi:hypothetical protein